MAPRRRRARWAAAAAAAAAAATLASVDALAPSTGRRHRLLGPPAAGATRGMPPPPSFQGHRRTRLSMTTATGASDDGNDLRRGSGGGVGVRVRGALGKLSRRVRERTVKGESFRRKLASLAVAFSALLFVGAGSRQGELLAAPSDAAPSVSSATSSVARGGSAAAARGVAPKSGLLNAITSRARHRSGKTAAASSPISPVDRTIVDSWDDLRGGFAKEKKPPTAAVEEVATQTKKTFRDALTELREYMSGPKSDTLCLLFATALVTPLCKMAGTSPILGFLAAGMAMGPNGFGVISGIHTTETLAELGIVFFLFEMGIELSVERLKSMRRDVFGLGLSQYVITAAILGGAARIFGGLPANAAIVVGGALSLSSSAFVLQLIKDKKELATRFGKAAFGVLLLQDLAVVPLLVATPILAGSGSLASALGGAVVKAAMALSGIALTGRFALNPLFKTVAAANSQEAFLGVILLTALGMSFLTEGLGLSNTLGAFLAGVLLSETKYRYQVEADIAPFRGILLGLFFVTVGFEIDVGLIARNLPTVGAIVAGILGLKAGVLTLLGRAFGLSSSTALRTGLILSQGGEFAFVAFGLARSLGILDQATTKMLLTSVSLTMALTPLLDSVGTGVAKKIEEGADFTHYMGQDDDAMEITDDNSGFVVVVGYGVVGKVVCDLLDRKFIKYVGMERDPKKAIEARNRGLPVFFGDVGRPEVAEAFNVDKAKAVIVTVSDKAEATRAVIALRRMYPNKPIFARAKDADHAKRLQTTLDVAAMVPILPEDNLLLTLPFGGAVLRSLGAPAEEVNYILAEKRREVLSGKELEKFEEETVLAQLGVEKPEEEDGGDVVEGDVMPTEVVDVAAPGKDEQELPEGVKYVEKIMGEEAKLESASPDATKEVAEPKELEVLKPLVKQVVEANISPESKKADPEAPKPLVKQVVEANISPESKKTEVSDDAPVVEPEPERESVSLD